MNKKGKNIQDLLSDLQKTLDAMDSEEMNIENTIQEYAKAAGLIEKCYVCIREAKMQVQEIDERIIALEAEDDL